MGNEEMCTLAYMESGSGLVEELRLLPMGLLVAMLCVGGIAQSIKCLFQSMCYLYPAIKQTATLSLSKASVRGGMVSLVGMVT